MVADLIENRLQARSLTALLVASLAASALGAGGWPCPFRWALGVPCPGCGLSRGTTLLLAGHGSAALAAHPLAPLALFASLLLVAAALLPAATLTRLVLAVRRAERRVPLASLVVIALLAVWAVRLALPSLYLPLSF